MPEQDLEKLGPPSIVEFARAIVGSWISLMSGAIGVGLSLIAPFVEIPTYKPIMYAASVFAAIGAFYAAWAAERRERLRSVSIALAKRPHVIPLMIMSDDRTAILSVKNVGNAPATHVQFESIRSRNSTASFVPVQVISPDGQEEEVVVSMAGGARDLWELLDEMTFFQDVPEAATKWPDYGKIRISDTGMLRREEHSGYGEKLKRAWKRPYQVPLKFTYEGADGERFVGNGFCLVYTATGSSSIRDTRSLIIAKCSDTATDTGS